MTPGADRPPTDDAGVDAGGGVEHGLGEATLVGRAQEGDVDSFEHLVRDYQGPVFRLAQRILQDRGDAEDVVQDTFVAVWRRLPTLTEAALFRAWVFQIATRRCLNVLRTRTRHPDTPTEGRDLEAAHDAAWLRTPHGSVGENNPSAAAEHAAQMAGLDAILGSLTAEQRTCWVLREMHDLSYPEIAYITKFPVSTVRGRIARARQNLAKGMQPWR